jgi:hypothetical protein
MSLMKVVAMAALFALFCVGGAADIGSLVAQLDDPLMKEIIGSMRVEMGDVKRQVESERKDKAARRAELKHEQKHKVAMQGHITALQDSLYDFSNKTEADGVEMSARLDQCEAALGSQSRRRTQQSSICGPEALESMLVACCDSRGPAGNGHRLLQNGCDSLPPMCSLQCSA